MAPNRPQTYKTIEERWTHAYNEVREYARDYALNHAYLEGRQWLQFDPVELLLNNSVPDDIDRLQATMNRMRANHRTLISQLTKQPLVFEVTPSAYDDATLRSAKVSEAILRDLHDEHDWEVKREGLMTAVLKGGTAVVAVDWDAANKTTLETVLSVTEFVCEPGARDLETARWWIRQQLLPPEEVQAMFPEHFSEGPPDADGRTPYAAEYRSGTQEVDQTRVFTYYERPNPLCPDGKFCVEVNGKLLQEGKWPFPWTRHLNIAAARETLIENQAFGSTILSDARGPQTALNAAWSGFLEHVRESSTHRLAMDESWIDAIETLNDRAGAPLYGPMAKGVPQYLKAPPVPTGLLDAIALLQAEIDNLLGVHDVSRGMAPRNIESGYGIQILTENDASPVGRLIRETARAFTRVARMVLQLHEQEVKETREAILHEGQSPAVRKWKGSDIKGQTRALVPLDAIVPKSQAAQQQWAQQAVQMGLIPADDPLAIMRFSKLADMPDQRGIVNAMLPDAAKATRENEAVVLSEVPIPASFDDHAMHIEIHNEFRKSLQYELLTDEQRSDIDLHIQAHESMMASQMAGRRQASMVDPELGMMPRADGAVPVEPLPPEPLPAEAPAPEGGGGPAGPTPPDAPEMVDADTMSTDILSAIDML